MRVLVCGAGGQLGRELLRLAPAFPLEVGGVSREHLDVTCEAGVRSALAQWRPDLVINAAAYTKVDAAEQDPEAAYAVNRDGVANLAKVAAERDIPVLHVSTDYVFSGAAHAAYRESDPTGPGSVYGASKLAGEAVLRETLERHLIVRTSWVFSAYGNNFVKSMLRLGRERETLAVVGDQIGCPTYAGAIAEALLVLATRYAQEGTLAWGLYHYSGTPACSWYLFAREILRAAHAAGLLPRLPNVTPIATADYPAPACRPAWSVLDCTSFQTTFGIVPRHWSDDLRQVIGQLAEQAA